MFKTYLHVTHMSSGNEPRETGTSEEWWGITSGRLCERVSDLEKVEFPEVPIDRIQPPDAVLTEKGRQMGVGNKVAADGKVGCHLTVDLQKSFPPSPPRARARGAEGRRDLRCWIRLPRRARDGGRAKAQHLSEGARGTWVELGADRRSGRLPDGRWVTP